MRFFSYAEFEFSAGRGGSDGIDCAAAGFSALRGRPIFTQVSCTNDRAPGLLVHNGNMPNDAKLGLIFGIGLVVLIGVVFFRKDGGAPSPAVLVPAPQTQSIPPLAPIAGDTPTDPFKP